MNNVSQKRKITPGIYQHFKGGLYQVLLIAQHTEMGEWMVVYQALYGDYGLYVRPYDMFAGKVDHEKYPDVSQCYRFEQAENIKNCVPVIRSCDPGELEPLWIDSVLGPDISRFQMMSDSCPYYRASVDFLEKENNDTVHTTNNREQELEYALLCMIAQYCQDEHDKYVTHKWMYAGETAFGILGIEDATPVSEIWRRIEELEKSQKSM